MSETDYTDQLNQLRGGYNEAMGLTFTRVTPEVVEAEIEIGAQHLQPYGLVHGGVYAAMIETVCSTAAAIRVMPQGKTTVGLENTTAFLRAVRGGKIRAHVEPLLIGKRTHVWQGKVFDDENRLVATGRVRMMILEEGAAAGGETIGIQLDTESPE